MSPKPVLDSLTQHNETKTGEIDMNTPTTTNEAGDIGFCRQQVNGPSEAYEIIQDTLAQAEVCFISIPPYDNFLRSLNTQNPSPVFYYARVRDKYEAIKVSRKPVPGFPDGVEITFAYKFIHKL